MTRLHLTAGSRQSQLARWQTNHVLTLLGNAWPALQCETRFFVTQGDKQLNQPLPEIGGKGLFTAELERALLAGEIDLAVHSLKDLPVADAPGLTVGAIPARADVRDVLVSRSGAPLVALPAGAIVGTSSRRRAAQLLAARPDLTVRSIRGNVETRLRKVRQGDYDAAVLAYAGIARLELEDAVTQVLTLDEMLPAPGQGALGVQCRADDRATLNLLAALEDLAARQATRAERAFLAALGGGCAAPVAAFATVTAGEIRLRGLVGALDGQAIVRVEASGHDAEALGHALAEQALDQGAGPLLAAAGTA